MTTSTKIMLPDNSTDANFRAWGSGVSAALAAIGLVQTSDTGQINWASVSKPSGSSNYPGYEVWRFPSDANQTAAPIFMKIEYGSASGSANYPSIRVTLAQGSDGAGTLTGLLSNATSSGGPGAITLSMTGNSTTVYVPWHFCYSNGIFTMGIGPVAGVASYGMALQVFRLHNSSGQPRSDGWGFTAVSSGLNLAGCYRVALGTWGPAPQGILGFWPYNTGVTSRSGGKILIGPVHVISGLSEGPMERTLGMVYVSSVDWREGDVFPVTRWDGVTHYYKVLSITYSYTSTYLAVLFE